MTIPVNLFRLDKPMPGEDEIPRGEFYKLLHEKRPDGTQWCGFFHGSAADRRGATMCAATTEVLLTIRPEHEPKAFFFNGQTLVDCGFRGAIVGRGVTVIYI